MTAFRRIRVAAVASVLLVSGVAKSSARGQKEGSSSDTRIAGTIVNKIDGHPLARARVTVRSAKDSKNVHSLITVEDGKFEFAGLLPGKYSLEGAKRGFIEAAYDQHDAFSTAIVTGAGLDTEHLVLKLSPDAVIAGKVVDEAGEPVRQAMVNLYYDNHDEGIEQISHYRSAQTDDLGMYEMSALRPGTYFISATAKPWYAVHPRAQANSSQGSGSGAQVLDVAYPLTFYADVTDADSATPIPVRGGERVQADVHLSPVPALRLLFHVPENGKSGFDFPLLEQQAFDVSTPLQFDSAQMISPGLVEVTGVPAGRYDVRMQRPNAGVQLNGINVDHSGEEIDTSKGAAFATVNISVQMPDGGPFPQRMGIGLRANRKFAGWKPVDDKGQLQVENIPAGQYELVAFGGGLLYAIDHISAEGAEVTGHTVAIAAGSSPSLVVSVVTGSVEVEGVVKHAGKTFAGAMVVLVPTNPEGNRDQFRRDQSDQDGTFALRNVAPGTYTVIALENGWDLDWSRPEVIAAYIKHGRGLEVKARSASTVHLPEAVEVVRK